MFIARARLLRTADLTRALPSRSEILWQRFGFPANITLLRSFINVNVMGL